MAGKFEGTDFYDVDSLLSEEERMVRDTVREWVEERVMPIIGKAYIDRQFPKELIPELGEQPNPQRQHHGDRRCWRISSNGVRITQSSGTTRSSSVNRRSDLT